MGRWGACFPAFFRGVLWRFWLQTFENARKTPAVKNLFFTHVHWLRAPVPPPPVKIDSQRAPKQLKNWKAPGHESVHAELLEIDNGEPIVLERLQAILVDLWNGGQIPQEWKDATIKSAVDIRKRTDPTATTTAKSLSYRM